MTEAMRSDDFSLPPLDMNGDGSGIIDGWRDVLGATLAEQRHHWDRERERIEAQADKIIAELRVEVMQLRIANDAVIKNRLDQVDAAIKSRLDQVDDAIKSRLDQLHDGKPGEQGPPGETGQPGA